MVTVLTVTMLQLVAVVVVMAVVMMIRGLVMIRVTGWYYRQR
jgi:hypothetical protein